jgi:hypothetical protein
MEHPLNHAQEVELDYGTATKPSAMEKRQSARAL